MEQLDFTPENRLRLDAFLAASHPPGSFATFDLDGTCVHHDTGEAVLHAMAREELFDAETLLGSPSIWAPFEHYPRVPSPREQLVASIRGDALPGSVFEAFVTAYRRLIRCVGKEVAYPWAAMLLAGKTVDEVRALSRRVIASEVERPLAHRVLADGVCEERGFEVAEGLRPYTAMNRLVVDLRGAGIETWIVTASNRWTAEVYAEMFLQLGPERVIGMTPAVRQGRIEARMDPFVPATFDAGKVEAIRTLIGSDPVFAAGDSLSQCEMLCLASGLKLVIDKGDENLAERVAGYRAAGDPDWLVQPAFIGKGEAGAVHAHGV